MTTNNDNTMTTNTENTIEHPNVAWAASTILASKPDITPEEMATLWWHNGMRCYLVQWKGMTLGIETDGHIHS